jgi:hypothetical protein
MLTDTQQALLSLSLGVGGNALMYPYASKENPAINLNDYLFRGAATGAGTFAGHIISNYLAKQFNKPELATPLGSLPLSFVLGITGNGLATFLTQTPEEVEIRNKLIDKSTKKLMEKLNIKPLNKNASAADALLQELVVARYEATKVARGNEPSLRAKPSTPATGVPAAPAPAAPAQPAAAPAPAASPDYDKGWNEAATPDYNNRSEEYWKGVNANPNKIPSKDMQVGITKHQLTPDFLKGNNSQLIQNLRSLFGLLPKEMSQAGGLMDTLMLSGIIGGGAGMLPGNSVMSGIGKGLLTGAGLYGGGLLADYLGNKFGLTADQLDASRWLGRIAGGLGTLSMVR